MTEAQQAQALRLRAEGHSLRSVASRVGASPTSVARLLRSLDGRAGGTGPALVLAPPVVALEAATPRVLTLRSTRARLSEALDAATDGREIAALAAELRKTSQDLERAELLAASDAAARIEAEQAGRADELEAAIDQLVVRTRGVTRTGTG